MLYNINQYEIVWYIAIHIPIVLDHTKHAVQCIRLRNNVKKSSTIKFYTKLQLDRVCDVFNSWSSSVFESSSFDIMSEICCSFKDLLFGRIFDVANWGIESLKLQASNTYLLKISLLSA